MPSMWIKENRDFERPCMITCALSGVVANRDQCPAIPYTPEEYAAEAKRAYEAGAAVVHIHARTREGLPSYEVQDYKNIYDAVTDACPVIINFSTGAINITTQQKIAHIQGIRPAIGALNMGSMNYAKYNSAKKKFVFEFVFPNPFSEIMQIVEAMNSVSTKPELECFDTGQVGNSFPLIDMGLLKPPYQYSLIMGVLGRDTAHRVESHGYGRSAKTRERLGSDCGELRSVAYDSRGYRVGWEYSGRFGGQFLLDVRGDGRFQWSPGGKSGSDGKRSGPGNRHRGSVQEET